jgi:hypothetical protein
VNAFAVTVGRRRRAPLRHVPDRCYRTSHCYTVRASACGQKEMKFPIACLLVSAVLLCRHVGVVLAQPVNDLCVNAISIMPGSTTLGTNVGAFAVDMDLGNSVCTNPSGKLQPREPFPPSKVSRHGCICHLLLTKKLKAYGTR